MTASFRAPRFDLPGDLEGNIKLLPPGATVRGMFFTDLVEHVAKVAPQVDLAAVAGTPPRRYVAFLEYPYADLLRTVVAAAKVVYPSLPQGEGVRRLGHRAYGTLLDSHAGRVLFGVLGVDVEKVLVYGPKGYRIATNFAKVSAEKVGEGRFRYEFGSPMLIEHYQVGVIEGALLHYKAAGEITIAMTDLSHAELAVTLS